MQQASRSDRFEELHRHRIPQPRVLSAQTRFFSLGYLSKLQNKLYSASFCLVASIQRPTIHLLQAMRAVQSVSWVLHTLMRVGGVRIV